MIISVFNKSNGAISDIKLQQVIRAINIQIEQDFEPYWSFGATLRLEGHTVSRKSANAKPYNPLDMRGDAIVYVWDKYDSDLDGMHDKDFRGVPYGVVFLDLSKELNEDWSVTLSHEALELVGDPQANLVVQGPHPVQRDRDVFHWFEMCDAVQAQSYEINGIGVADFVLPLYFTRGAEPGARNNFMGEVSREGAQPNKLKSFSVTHGGYVGFFDPHKGDNVTYEAPDDTLAQQRRAVKSGRAGRRFQRAKNNHFGFEA